MFLYSILLIKPLSQRDDVFTGIGPLAGGFKHKYHLLCFLSLALFNKAFVIFVSDCIRREDEEPPKTMKNLPRR
jgi:hypothetical protein